VANRRVPIYTRRGDEGTTALATGSRLPKHHLRIETLGAIDELNSAIGLTRAQRALAVDETLERVQHELFELGAELAQPGNPRILPLQVRHLEMQIDTWDQALAPLQEFILPGGGPVAATCHLARAICRRAERSLVRLAAAESLNPESLRYLHRLSDLLFVAARVLARQAGPEVPWRPQAPSP
jgi:cob(I)alamin adenosyltransferase